MITLQIFDRPMCCSTGVCGPSVDSALVKFAADLKWLEGQGVQVERYNLAQQPQAFVAHEDVKAALPDANALPLVKVNGHIVSKGVYPSRPLLAAWCGVALGVGLPMANTPSCGPAGCC
jgi:arsenite methyltransferase